jgi:uncharacterized membrane protein
MFKLKTMWLVSVFCLLSSPVLAYNPGSFTDEETISVQGKRPKVEINVTELIITINTDDFVDGKATASTSIVNNGTVPCHLALQVQNVPIDLSVNASVDSIFLQSGESTSLNISVELSEQQEAEDFTFTILVEATLQP